MILKIKNPKRLAALLLTLPVSLSAFAQETAGAPPAAADSVWSSPLFWATAAVSVCVLLILLQIVSLLSTLRTLLDSETAAGAKPKPLFDLTGAVPIEREKEIMMHHEYDGIRELDNVLPPWWVYLFYATILFGVGYIWFYHFSSYAKGQADEYQTELVEAEEEMKKMANSMDETTVTMLTDPAKIKEGETIYLSNCVACHGKLGEGGVGPNLTDDYWIHGGSIKDIFKTVKYGVRSKGMIPWQSQLSASQMRQVSSYIKTLRGTKPLNPKEPQGELYIEE